MAPWRDNAVRISAAESWPGAALKGRAGWETGVRKEFCILDNWPFRPIWIAIRGVELWVFAQALNWMSCWLLSSEVATPTSLTMSPYRRALL